jgi:uncharacterized protein (DUF1015 family)
MLQWKKEILEKHKDVNTLLDVSLLNEEILGNLLEIEDVRVDHRVKYVEGSASLDEIVAKTFKYENRMAFLLYPVAGLDLMHIAEANEVMPPKSTWFEPRVKNGLLVLEI